MPNPTNLHAPLQEKALMDAVERLEKRRAGRLALHVQLSRLSRANSREHYLRLATDMFANAVRAIEGQLFILQNHDLVFIAAGSPFAALDRAVDRLRALFSEDPIIAYKDTSPESFCVWYRLDSEYYALHFAAQQLLRDAELSRSDYVRKEPADGLAPLQPDLLGRVERTIDITDVTNLARRQMICSLVPGQEPLPLFEEIYISIVDLQAQITPGVNLLSNPWLFQYLSHALDRRIMAMLIKTGAPEIPFSINLNVASVLTPEFRRFEETIAPQLRGRLVVELNKLDVFADMGAFLFARDYLHDRGFRVCLDGLTHLTLPYYNRSRLGFDLIKLHWRPDGIEDMLPEMIPTIRSIVLEAGQARTILCRCENVNAFEIGQQLGIVMFQGRYVDRLVAHGGKPLKL